MKRVGLIGPPDREELVRLAIRIEERDGEPVFLDSRDDPAIELEPDRECACGVELRGIRSLYVADLGIPPYAVRAADGTLDPEASRVAAAASRRHLATWNALLSRMARRALVVNPPQTHDLHGLKAWEAMAYWHQGLTVPSTVGTGDPERLLALADAPPETGWIRKGLIGGLGYTEMLETPGDTTGAAALVEAGPLLIQEYIEGEDLRAYVVDRTIVGAAVIHSSSGTEIDSRRDLKRVETVKLPEAAAEMVLAAATRWGMSFAAVDLMYDARHDRYVLLECNSAPFFVGFEGLTGIEVSSRLAEHLLRGRAA